MVYITGDTHGDPNRLAKNDLKFLQEGDTLIVCGDFGIVWNKDGENKEEKYNKCDK